MQNQLDVKKISLPKSISHWLQIELQTYLESNKSTKKLASEIIKISTAFQQQKARTPWHTELSQKAYLAYFFPLNLIRNLAVQDRIQQFDCVNNITYITDIGSGCGTSHFANKNPDISWRFIEDSPNAIKLHQRLSDNPEKSQWHRGLERPSNLSDSTHLLNFSYSLNEFNGLPEWIFDAHNILIIEPSTQQSGRELMSFRQTAIEHDYHVLAPCTHQGSCPLLNESKKDWCHDRVFIDMPDWWKQIESHLPMKNDSITFSYLLLSKTAPTNTVKGQVRIVGDTLKQKGKTIQMVCRGEKREFFSWLKKNKNEMYIPRGSLIDLPKDITLVGNEIRINELLVKH